VKPIDAKNDSLSRQKMVAFLPATLDGGVAELVVN
jgi:hypothetical protein